MKLVVTASTRDIKIAWVFLGLKRGEVEKFVVTPAPGFSSPQKWILEFPGQVKNPKRKLALYGYTLVEVLDWGESTPQENVIDKLSVKLRELGEPGQKLARNLLNKIKEVEDLEKTTTLRRVK